MESLKETLQQLKESLGEVEAMIEENQDSEELLQVNQQHAHWEVTLHPNFTTETSN